MSQLSLSLLVSLAVLAACTPKPGQEPQEPVVKYHEGRETVVAGEFGYNRNLLSGYARWSVAISMSVRTSPSMDRSLRLTYRPGKGNG